MNTWNELINGPLRSEMLQLELLFQKMIESIPLIAVSAIAIFFGLLLLLAAFDRMFLEDKDLQLTKEISKPAEQYPQPATRLLLNDTNAAA